MTALLPIGDFSRMTHLSVKALRHYHDVGVLEPVAIDPFTGYRSYGIGQVAAAQVIRRLRDLGMPLDGIRTVLSATDVETRNAEIAAHLARMERQLAVTQASVASLRALLSEPAGHCPVQLRTIPEVTALAIREVVDAAAAWDWLGDASEVISAMLAKTGREASGCFGALFPGDFFEVERAEITLFQPVAEDTAARPDGVAATGGAAGRLPSCGRVRFLRIPAADVAVTVHEGVPGDIDRTYGALGVVVAERAIGISGPIREYYLVGYPDTGDESRHRTEVCWPVFRTIPA